MPDSSCVRLVGIASRPVATVSEIKNEVGPRITMMRERAKLSKRQLALLAGVHVWQLRQWERGDHIPGPQNLWRLIPHIGGTIEFYLFGKK